MKKLLFILSYSLYLFFLLGLILHTSAHPVFLGKYTLKYLFILIPLIIFFIPFLFLIKFIQTETKIKLKKKKYILKPTHKLIISLTIFIVLVFLPIETFLRLKYKNFESYTYRYTAKNFHPFLQMQPTQNQSLNINSFGFRAEEIQKIKPKDVYRIFALGGSTVFNSSITYQKTFEKILQDKLEKEYPDKKFEVINAGNDGFTSEHSIIQYLFKIKDFNPDLIIMWHGINDWSYSCSPKLLSTGEFQSDYSNFLGADANIVLNYFKPQSLISIKLVTIDFAVKFLTDNLYSDLLNEYKNKYPFKGIYTNDSKSNQFEMTKYPSLDSYKRNLQEFIDITKNDNVDLILGNQAYLYSTKLDSKSLSKLLYPRINCLNSLNKYPSLNSMIRSMQVFNNASETIAKENNIDFINLESAIPKNLDYFTDDVHYTEKGNDLIANIFYEYILSNNVIK